MKNRNSKYSARPENSGNCSVGKSDLFPVFVAKKNKNGVSPVILCFVMLFSIGCVATGSSFGVLMTVFSFVNALSDIVLCMVPFFLKKKYPHACNHSTFKMEIGLVYALSAFAFVVAAYLAYAMISTLDMTVWLMILAYDPHPKADLMDVAEYVSLEELYRRADIITLHMPLIPTTKYIINRESISMMKPGVIIINCARGPLADPDALIEGIESEKIGALGLDVIDGEEGITHVDHRVDIISNQKMAYLRQFRNVVMTQHMAFYTEEAVASMARCGIAGILDMAENKKGQWEI